MTAALTCDGSRTPYCVPDMCEIRSLPTDSAETETSHGVRVTKRDGILHKPRSPPYLTHTNRHCPSPQTNHMFHQK